VAGIGLLNVFTFSAQFALAIAIVRRSTAPCTAAIGGGHDNHNRRTGDVVRGDNSRCVSSPSSSCRPRSRVRLLAVLLTAQLLVVWAALTALYAFGLDGPCPGIQPTDCPPSAAGPCPGSLTLSRTPAETAHGSL